MRWLENDSKLYYFIIEYNIKMILYYKKFPAWKCRFKASQVVQTWTLLLKAIEEIYYFPGLEIII